MEIKKPTQGRIVEFFPSEKTAKKFKKQGKKSYAAIVADVNENSVDLRVIDAHDVFVERVAHKSEAAQGRSNWEWPVITQ
jgi:hypothetical protein